MRRNSTSYGPTTQPRPKPAPAPARPKACVTVDYPTFGMREVIVESPYGELAVLCDWQGVRIKSVNRDGSEFWVSDPIPWTDLRKP